MSQEEQCEFCRGEFAETVLKEYTNWEVQLFLNQYYLGRSLIKLKRHAVDLTELRENERHELFEKVLPQLKQTLDELFQPDLYNQATLGNDCRHFHLHVIPRYSSKRIFQDQKFKDENWNKHYSNYPENFEVEEQIFEKLKSKIGDEIKE